MSTERRPGDWICPSCDNNNFAHRDRCHLCHKPRESSSRHSPDRDRDRDREREREKDSRDDRDWICSGCDHRNHPKRSRCSRCDRYRSSSSSSSSSSRPNSYPSSVLPLPASYYPSAMPRGPLPSMRGPPPLAVPGMMGMLNPKAYAVPGMRPPGPASAYQPSARGDPEVRPGDWRCRHCDSNNFARREHCFNCKASRADAEARYSKHHESQSRMPMPVAPYAYAAYPASMYYNPSLYYMGAAPSRLGLKRDRDEEESVDYGRYRKRDRREDYDYHRDDRDYRRDRERDREHDRERDHDRDREHERERERERPRERERQSRRSQSPQRRSASPRNSSSGSDLHHRHHSHHHHHHHDDNSNIHSSNGHNNREDSLSPPAGRSSRYSPAPVSPSLHSPLSSSHSREKRDHDDEDSAGFDELNDVL